MGSADFGIPALERLMLKHSIVGVVSTPAKPKGRGLKLFDSPVTEFARAHGLGPIITPEKLKDPSFVAALTNLKPDLFVVVAYRILPREVFTIPTFGTVNIHASLLPKFRGAAPIHRAIEAGEKETGVTIFRIDEGIDTGEILARERTPIGEEETTPQLYERLSQLGAELLERVLDKMEQGSIEPLAQDEQLVSKAPKLSREEAHVQWSLTAEQIYNKIRAFKPFPGIFFLLGERKISIEWATPVDQNSAEAAPGEVIEVNRDYFNIQCGQGALRVTEVKPEGKKNMSVQAFLLGTTLVKGTVLQ